MFPMTKLVPTLVPYVDAVLDAGFDVTAPQTTAIKTSYVFITKADQPGCVIMEEGEFPTLGQSPQLSIPVKPNREYGSAVALDFEGEPEDLAAVIEPAIASATVRTRFIEPVRTVNVEKRLPKNGTALTRTSVES
jgi:hypothetical protein